MRLLAICCFGLMFSGCIHLAGVVVNDKTGQPFRTAKITVGRPDGIAVYDSHMVDSNGKFDFYIGPTDDSDIYVYDTATEPEYTMIRLDRSEISTNMRIRLHAASPEVPGMPRIPVMP